MIAYIEIRRLKTIFYRNPVAFKELERKVRLELAEFKPVQNSREAILNKVKRIDTQ